MDDLCFLHKQLVMHNSTWLPLHYIFELGISLCITSHKSVANDE